jgi:plasmid stabilization system protein ParE
MKIRWSPASAEDLEQIFNYIRTDNPGAAQRVTQTIYDWAEALGADPYLGRRGRVEGTRGLPLPPPRSIPGPLRTPQPTTNNQPPTTNNQQPITQRSASLVSEGTSHSCTPMPPAASAASI